MSSTSNSAPLARGPSRQGRGPRGTSASRRRRGQWAGRRTGGLGHLRSSCGIVLALSAYPLYYSFLLGSSDAATIAREPDPVARFPGATSSTNVQPGGFGGHQVLAGAVANSILVAVLHRAVGRVLFDPGWL
ncbi:MAG: hypothetical protein V9F04_05690 [Dermatophilaceae bacterium]